MGPAVNLLGEDSRSHDIIFRKVYILYSDLGVYRKGGNYPQKIGERLATERVKAKNTCGPWTTSCPTTH